MDLCRYFFQETQNMFYSKYLKLRNWTNYILYKIYSRKPYQLKNINSICELVGNGFETFFGYYDKTPFSLNNSLLLGMKLKYNSLKRLKIGYFDLNKDNIFYDVGTSESWSWQLGTRLQWYPQNENEIICYNKMVEGQYGSVLQSIKTRKIEEQYYCPIFDISNDGTYAISLNFSRLHRLRPGYGYRNLPDFTESQLRPENDGIYLLNLKNSNKSLIISLDSICNLKPKRSMEKAQHYFNHLSFSPNGKRFLFLHLWINNKERFSRLITSDIYGNNLNVLENTINISHYTWKSANQILAHTSTRPFGTKFYLYEDLKANKKLVGEGFLNQSGHPSYSPDGRYLIVDTYPDKYRRQNLILYTADGEYIAKIGSFSSPYKFSGENKCDLHPRWDRKGKFICFDSAMNGRRSMYIIKI